MAKTYFVYILASKRNGTLYIGITNNLERRTYEHKAKVTKGFTAKYNVSRLVHYEETSSAEAAIAREKQLKNWRRQWKLNVINATNPGWRDLALDFIDSEINSE